MKKIALFLCVGLLFLSGCGTQLLNLTEDEESQIISYASYILLKYNGAAQKGITDAQIESSDTTEETQKQEAAEEPSEEETTSGDAGEQTSSGDASSSAGEEQDSTISDLAIDEVLDFSGCSLSYVSCETAEDYTEGTYFSMTPASGCDYLILKFSIANKSDAETNVDLIDQLPMFSAQIDGETYSSLTTVLSGDLANINETIAAGDSLEAVLLFEIPEGSAGAVTSVSVKADGNSGSMEIP